MMQNLWHVFLELLNEVLERRYQALNVRGTVIHVQQAYYAVVFNPDASL